MQSTGETIMDLVPTELFPFIFSLLTSFITLLVWWHYRSAHDDCPIKDILLLMSLSFLVYNKSKSVVLALHHAHETESYRFDCAAKIFKWGIVLQLALATFSFDIIQNWLHSFKWSINKVLLDFYYIIKGIIVVVSVIEYFILLNFYIEWCRYFCKCKLVLCPLD